MLRAAGVPARVVAGYQGGELSRGGNVWEVRQNDAHAWTEVWLEGQGWVRVDPTAFVAPERVEQGMNAMTQSQGASLFGEGAGAQISYQQYQMLQALRRLSDQASYYWQKDVVGYDQDKQADSLLKWFNIRSIGQQIIWLAASAITVMSVLIFIIWQRRRKRWHIADLPLAQLSKRLSKRDKLLARGDSEGQLAWLERLAATLVNRTDDTTLQRRHLESNDADTSINHANSEDMRAKIEQIQQDYRQLRYGRLSTLDSSNREYQTQLKQLKKHIRQLL